MYKLLIFALLSFIQPLQSTPESKINVYEHVAGLNKIEVNGIVSKVKSYQTFDSNSYFVYIGNNIFKISENEYEKNIIIGKKYSCKGLRKLQPEDYLKYNLFRK